MRLLIVLLLLLGGCSARHGEKVGRFLGEILQGTTQGLNNYSANQQQQNQMREQARLIAEETSRRQQLDSYIYSRPAPYSWEIQQPKSTYCHGGAISSDYAWATCSEY